MTERTSLTLDDINRAVRLADYHVFPSTTTTVCCLTLRDGFTVIGQSACIDPAMFDAALGRRIAYDDAIDKVWQLEGYLLAHQLRRGEAPTAFANAPDAGQAAAPQAPSALDVEAVLLSTPPQDPQEPSTPVLVDAGTVAAPDGLADAPPREPVTLTAADVGALGNVTDTLPGTPIDPLQTTTEGPTTAPIEAPVDPLAAGAAESFAAPQA